MKGWLRHTRGVCSDPDHITPSTTRMIKHQNSPRRLVIEPKFCYGRGYSSRGRATYWQISPRVSVGCSRYAQCRHLLMALFQ